MNIVPLIKTVAGLVTSVSAGAVIGNAIKATTPADLKRMQKIAVGFGGVILAAAAGELAGNYVEEQVQTVADNVMAARGRFSPTAEAAKEAAEATGEFIRTAASDVKETVEEVIETD